MAKKAKARHAIAFFQQLVDDIVTSWETFLGLETPRIFLKIELKGGICLDKTISLVGGFNPFEKY